MTIAIDPEMVGGFFAFISEELLNCPRCKKKTSKAQTLKAQNNKKSNIVCPFCKTKIL